MRKHFNLNFRKLGNVPSVGAMEGAVLLSLLSLSMALSPLVSAHAQTTHTVLIEEMRYKPPMLSVAVGDTVVWRNVDLVAHTATAANHSFKSGPIEASKSWSLRFETEGKFDYTCLFHPQMMGKIEVTGGVG